MDESIRPLRPKIRVVPTGEFGGTAWRASMGGHMAPAGYGKLPAEAVQNYMFAEGIRASIVARGWWSTDMCGAFPTKAGA